MHNNLINLTFFLKNDRPIELRGRGHSSSPPPGAPSIASPPLSSFSPLHRNNQQPLVSTTDPSKRLSTHMPSAVASNYGYLSNQSTTFTNILTPIFSHLANKYRQSSPSIEQSIDELKNAFQHLDQQNPGACDLFVKYLFQYLKPASSNTAST